MYVCVYVVLLAYLYLKGVDYECQKWLETRVQKVTPWPLLEIVGQFIVQILNQCKVSIKMYASCQKLSCQFGAYLKCKTGLGSRGSAVCNSQGNQPFTFKKKQRIA